ncbi:2-oxo-4-hydroxy-4-carboxy-5-ureidoimidazoline decarboxylase [Arthrobacter roseus]|uniref:2-oxo-4-hydroxy-4-carboxy-5-ureidoimidazoline decarboxylase n=1 Tax=Arthrobacter roseus TaxID=136274 RepID=UPI0019633D41|nr:2-oxo-4-hydroxy-4-carboxy-5-ureidoimidazoline decarboxylase [Arthrobacter roseus]MBM7847011.1 2-oxo-4-hydroxy-4-carboxy-5-ureidoimidazoline decarboxylase [Arthrobacter roseus]
MTLTQFNTSSPAEVAALLRPCVDIPRWVDEIVVARPFASQAALIEYAEKAAEPWTETEIDGALAHHPRIGERAEGSSKESELSLGEQAGLDSSDAITEQLAAGNLDYDQKFGRVFLIRAAGRSSEEILASLRKRLSHTPDQELPVIAGQLREIAILRLKGALEA